MNTDPASGSVRESAPDVPSLHIADDIRELGEVRTRLERYGKVEIMQTSLSAFAFLFSSFYVAVSFHAVPIFIKVTMVLAAALLVSGLMISYGFDKLRRKGEVLFQRISTEFQVWRYRSEAATSGAVLPTEQEIRRTISDFSRSANLPFFPGRNGTAFFTLVNTLLTVSTIHLLLAISSW